MHLYLFSHLKSDVLHHSIVDSITVILHNLIFTFFQAKEKGKKFQTNKKACGSYFDPGRDVIMVDYTMLA